MNAVDLFAGCGGLSLGFQKQGFNIVAAFEWWDAAVNCYRANFSHPVFQTDLSNVAASVNRFSHFNRILLSAVHPAKISHTLGRE